MKTKAEILEIMRREKPKTRASYGLRRLAVFGSYARADQREHSEVDILVEIDPRSVSVSLNSRTELRTPLAFAPRSSRAGRSSHVIGRSSKRNWSMCRRTGEISPVFISVNLPGHYLIDSRLIALEDSNGFRSSNHVRVYEFESFQTFKMSDSFWPGA